MNTISSSPRHVAPKRALVLGGGGSTGNAWLIGVVAGLADAGLDVTDADLLVGTSAGATAAAQITGATPAELLDAILTGPAPTPTAPDRRGGRGRSGGPVTDHLERMRALIAEAEDLADFRRRIGAAALQREAGTDGSWQSRWRATVAARLPTQHWPERSLLLTAVDARTGEPVVLDRHSGVDLVDAVAASCSSMLPYDVGGKRCVDGGFRANADNVDLAAGHERVLVLSPLGSRSLHPPEWGTHPATQADELRAGGSVVETVVPDSASEALFGANAMNPSLRPDAARAGQRQGQAVAGRLSELWRGSAL
jgi:NTE family protein